MLRSSRIELLKRSVRPLLCIGYLCCYDVRTRLPHNLCLHGLSHAMKVPYFQTNKTANAQVLFCTCIHLFVDQEAYPEKTVYSVYSLVGVVLEPLLPWHRNMTYKRHKLERGVWWKQKKQVLSTSELSRQEQIHRQMATVVMHERGNRTHQRQPKR